MKDIRIVIADENYLTRAGFQHLFTSDPSFKVVGEAATGARLEILLEEESPDLVVFDYLYSEYFSIEDLQKSKAKYPDTRFLVVTNDNDKANIYKLLEWGGESILTKNCSREEILNAVRATVKGEKFFCAKVLDLILEKHLGKDEEDDCAPTSLSAREIEVISLVAQGHSTKVVAEMLSLSTHTIYTHRKNIMRKLKINSVSEMVLYAVNAGLVPAGQQS